MEKKAPAVGSGAPLHDPAELLAELDSIVRDQESLRQRVIALQARYEELQPDAERFNEPGEYEWETKEFGSLNVKWAAKSLHDAADRIRWPGPWFELAREYAVKVREYRQHDAGRDQVGQAADADPGAAGRPPQASPPAGSRMRESMSWVPAAESAQSSALADYQPGNALVDRVEDAEADRGRSR